MKEKKEMSTVPVSRRGRKEGFGKKFMGVLVVALLPVVAVLGATVHLFLKRSKPEIKKGLAYRANVMAGDIPDKSKEERQRELDSVAEEGMFAISISAAPSGPRTGHDHPVDWLIENPSNQGKLIHVKIYRNDTGEKIYETGAIRPGSYVEPAPPDTDLPVGECDCTTRFYIYRLKAEECIDRATARIRLATYE